MNVTPSKQLLHDAIFVGAYVGIMWGTWWLVTHPPDIQSFKMKYFKDMEKRCMANAQFWADRADMYSKAYDNLRSVTL